MIEVLPFDAARGSDPAREPAVCSFDEIRRLLPHREPFVLVDRVVGLEPRRRIVCLKNVSGAEPIFAQHFPSYAIFPGALLLEAMAQAALLLFRIGDRGTEDAAVPVLAAARVRWNRPVRPGDQLVIEVTVEKQVSVGAVLACEATVDGRTVATCRLTVGAVRVGS